MLSATLISIHNIQFLVDLVKRARKAILEGSFPLFASSFLEAYQIKEPS